MWWIILLVLVLVIAALLWWKKQQEEEWQLEQAYLLRHESREEYGDDCVKPQAAAPKIKPNFLNIRLKKQEQDAMRADYERIQAQMKPKKIRHKAGAPKEQEDLLKEPELPIAASAKMATEIPLVHNFTEYDKTLVEKTLFRQPENTKEPLPQSSLEEITLAEATRILSAKMPLPPEKPIQKEVIELNWQPRKKDYAKRAALPEITIGDPALNRVRARAQQERELNQPSRTKTTTISDDDIRANLVRRSLARQYGRSASAHDKKITDLPIIAEHEALANLEKTNAPAARYAEKRTVVRESVIPAAARINQSHTIPQIPQPPVLSPAAKAATARLVKPLVKSSIPSIDPAAQVISSRFTPFLPNKNDSTDNGRIPLVLAADYPAPKNKAKSLWYASGSTVNYDIDPNVAEHTHRAFVPPKSQWLPEGRGASAASNRMDLVNEVSAKEADNAASALGARRSVWAVGQELPETNSENSSEIPEWQRTLNESAAKSAPLQAAAGSRPFTTTQPIREAFTAANESAAKSAPLQAAVGSRSFATAQSIREAFAAARTAKNTAADFGQNHADTDETLQEAESADFESRYDWSEPQSAHISGGNTLADDDDTDDIFEPHSAAFTNFTDYTDSNTEKREQPPLPDLDLLLPPQFDADAQQTEETLLENGIIIEEKLAEFKVKVNVVDAYAGPVITRYEIEPAQGVRGNQVVNLEKDLARSLGFGAIRVVETIPGKTCMGLELPNPRRQMIRLSEIFNAPVFRESRSKLTLALGQDITGAPVVTDLAKAPHLLVAGTTGSGKSVGVNAMILSMLFKASPEEVRLIMIDPKMLELSIYEGIPHLLAPVVTDMNLAANALTWCVNEMEKRYRLMSHVGVRNLAGFNQKINEAAAHRQKLANPFSLTPATPEPLEKLPFIVVVVDEFADLMMVAGKKIEELIARLAQKARAAGIHLILATQRPSVDVITGLIKANIPTRVAFQVSSKIDSRTILDQMGAENLLGQGDMLFLPPGTGYPQRVHGAFVADEEVHRVVDFLKQFGEPQYVDDILSGGVSDDDMFSNAGGSRSNDGDQDTLYDEAVSLVIKSRKASISSVQRQLRIGYNRAARMVEQMETDGVVSAAESNGNRTVLAQNLPTQED
ncbi:DNA translocase FtsK [Stenoxybacter acetivorans]|uniref:DNA translocase FtsK n=1 Tax=Stenoxybacter acetivorans TaxID=422441 RepID=UPI00056B68B8|nr:DNA translocase FtsK [Stenoxybacter acetivorans]